MGLLNVTIYLSCLMMSVKGLDFKKYCYDPPELSCAEEHILDCGEEQVITTDIPGFHVDFLKNRNYPECQTGEDKCKNKTTCCININSKAALVQNLVATDNTPLINFIKTECSSKSSCIVNYYYATNSTGSSDLYDFVTYNYGCIPAVKDNITVDFLVNKSTKFTGSRSPTVYYLDYTGSGTKDNDVILNRECIVTTTEKDITLTIKKLNLQADDCCRFHISRYNVREYCSQNGSCIPPKAKLIGKNTATIRLENIVNKDGDSFSILVKAAGNVTIDCREITNVDKPEPINCQYPTPESSTINNNITVDFLVNKSTKFTGSRSPTVYYLDYTGSGTKDNDVILNRKCIVTTTEKDITLTIKKLNLQADDCCRFHISRYNVREYCSQNGSCIPPKAKLTGKNTATIRLENIVNKDGDSFSILVKAAGNVTIDCREITNVDKPESITCQYPTSESSTLNSSSTPPFPPTTSLGIIPPNTEERKKEDSETNLPGLIGGTVGGLVVLVVIIIVVVVILRRRRRAKDKVDEDDYYSTVEDNPKNNPKDNQKDNAKENSKGRSSYTYVDVDLDKVGYKTMSINGANQVKSGSGKVNNPKEEDKKHPIFKRQDFSFVKDNFRKNKESEDSRKRSISNEKTNDETKGESEAVQYTYIDDSIIKPLATKDSGKQNGPEESSSDKCTKVDKKPVKFIPTSDKAVNIDNYNHIGLKEAPPGAREQDIEDNYNHIDSNTKNDNSIPKGSNSQPSNNHNYFEIDLPHEDDYDDTYDHAQQGGGSLILKNKSEQNVSDTYNHIGINNDNSVSKGANSELENTNSVYSEANAIDTYNHIGANNDNSVSKGGNLDSDTYSHIGTNNDNSVSKGGNLDSDTYNHIGANNDNSVSKGGNLDSDTYSHIGTNNDNSVSKGGNLDSDTYNHIGNNNDNSVSKGANLDSDTYNHIGNDNSKGANLDSDTYNHIGSNNDPLKGAHSVLDTYNHIEANTDNSKSKRAPTSKRNQTSDNYNHINL